MTSPLVEVGLLEQKLAALSAFVEADDFAGALTFNKETAREMPFAGAIEARFLEKIGETWGWLLPEAKEEWTKARAATPRPAVSSGRRMPTRPKSDAEELDAAIKLRAAERVRFHKSDMLPERKLPTIEEKDRALERLADLRTTDPLAYAEGRREWAEKLFTTVAAIDQAVKLVLDRRDDDGEQSQATKLIAIGIGGDATLWHSPEGAGYASVWTGEHWENYAIGSTAYSQWLLHKYGQRNQGKVDGKLVPQAPGQGAIRDAIAQLKGIARFKEEFQPVMRVGGDYETIWIDLGGPNWEAVRVTAEGWKLRGRADVPFIRTGTMLALPEPVEGGSVKLLKNVLNVRPEEFVLVAAWLLQTLNPEGPYPIMNVHGETGDGKTWTSNRLVMTVNPNTAPLRTPEKIEDLFIAARNNWTVGFDNLSWLSAAWADRLCSLSTGIAVGKRTHYTDDEEHAFAVKRPVVFNGIPADLVQRSDIASRTIRLGILPIRKRKTEAELKEEFERIWPEVLGGLLDGLVGALRDWRGIVVEGREGREAARMADFERFAEAGCRAMGFAEWEFVEAYALNREGSMALAAESHSVGRAIIAFVKKHPDGFAGQMSLLYEKLERWKPDHLGVRDWPKSPTKLSTELRRLAKPLAACGIECATDVDRRPKGTQHDVIIRAKAAEPGPSAK